MASVTGDTWPTLIRRARWHRRSKDRGQQHSVAIRSILLILIEMESKASRVKADWNAPKSKIIIYFNLFITKNQYWGWLAP